MSDRPTSPTNRSIRATESTPGSRGSDSFHSHEWVAQIGPVSETCLDDKRAILERNVHFEHFRGQVAIAESAPSDRPPAARDDAHPHPRHERLQSHGVFDRAGERLGGRRANRRAEVLMENSPELDTRFKQECLASSEDGAMDAPGASCASHESNSPSLNEVGPRHRERTE